MTNKVATITSKPGASAEVHAESGVGPIANSETSRRWTNELLDQMRQHGDPPADSVVAALFRDHEVDEVRRVLRTLVQNDQPPPAGLPPEVREYLAATDDLVGVKSQEIERGQQLFAEHGPLILLCLAHYSLPAAYAAAKGVEVLHRTAYLEKRPAKRLFETTQMVIDVMTPGGLEEGGRGVCTAQKVRLMHAMVRHLIQHDEQRPWDRAWGVPINQEDLAGTLMTFSWITLDGLAKLGIHPSEQAQEDYLTAWRAVGRLMGIEEALLPANLAEAAELTQVIQARQIAPSEAGRQMTQALLEMVRDASQLGCVQDMSAALIWHFLPSEVAGFLGVPKHALNAVYVDVVRVLSSESDAVFSHLPGLAQAAHLFGQHFLQWMVNVELGGRSAAFVIPDHLRERWRLNPNSEPSFWARLLAWLARRFHSVL